MKCRNCHRKLKLFYFSIGMPLCKACALEIMKDIDDFRVAVGSWGKAGGIENEY